MLVVPAVLSLFMSAKLRFGRMVFGRQRYDGLEPTPIGSAVPGA